MCISLVLTVQTMVLKAGQGLIMLPSVMDDETELEPAAHG